MKQGLTELVFVIDRSGSMHGLERDTIGGLNATLDENRALPGEAIVSLVLFDNSSQVMLDRVPLEEVAPLTERDYRVGGCTALLDAVGDAVRYHAKVQQILPEKHRAEHVVFVVITDGLENASTHRTYREVKELVSRQSELGWQFLFLGANIDAAAEAENIGIARDHAAQYVSDSQGSAAAYASVARAECETRVAGAPSAGWSESAQSDWKARRHRR